MTERELERQATVEEAWARRQVYAGWMNAERLDEWHHVRAMMILEPDPPRPKPAPRPFISLVRRRFAFAGALTP